jgi:hypothetical protein
LPHALNEGAVDLLVRDLDIGLLPHLRKDEPEPDPTLGDAAVLGLRLLLRGALVGEGRWRCEQYPKQLI